MICQIQDSVFESLQYMKGRDLQLNSYRHGENTADEGFVLTSPSECFFIEVKTKMIADRYKIYLLLIDQVWQYELNEEINFELLGEGLLTEMHFFSRTDKDLKIENKIVPLIITECAVMLNFNNGQSFFIYPGEKLFGSTKIESDTDKILDIISALKLTHTRSI